MAGLLSEETRSRIQEAARRYPEKRSASLVALRLAQEQFGWLSPEVVAEVGAALDLDPNGLYQLVTFYDMFYDHPVGTYVLGVCNNLSCYLGGSDGLLSHLQQKLAIAPGETTEDGVFTLRTVECLAACDRAPAMMVNEDYHEKLTFEDVDRLLEKLWHKARGTKLQAAWEKPRAALEKAGEVEAEPKPETRPATRRAELAGEEWPEGYH